MSGSTPRQMIRFIPPTQTTVALATPHSAIKCSPTMVRWTCFYLRSNVLGIPLSAYPYLYGKLDEIIAV